MRRGLRRAREIYQPQKMHRSVAATAAAQSASSVMDQERLNLLTRLAEETVQMRQLIIRLRDEEIALLENDVRMLEAVMMKVEANKQKNYLNDVKYKTEKAKEEFLDRLRRWQLLEDSEPDWRIQLPTKKPQIRLDMRLMWPGQKEIGHFRRIYRELIRRPESRLGEKCLQALRERRQHQQLADSREDSEVGAQSAERIFLDELARQLRAGSDGSNSSGSCECLHQQQQPAKSLHELRSELQDRAAMRILGQIAETRAAIRHWEIPNCQETSETLRACRTRRRSHQEKRHQRRGDSRENRPAGRQQQLQQQQQRLSPVPDDCEGEAAEQSRTTKSDEATEEVSSRSMPPLLPPRMTVAQQQQQQQRRGGTRRASVMAGGHYLATLQDPDGHDATVAAAAMSDAEEARARVWEQVQRCRYIRGYEPPEIHLPAGQTAMEFVFGQR